MTVWPRSLTLLPMRFTQHLMLLCLSYTGFWRIDFPILLICFLWSISTPLINTPKHSKYTCQHFCSLFWSCQNQFREMNRKKAPEAWENSWLRLFVVIQSRTLPRQVKTFRVIFWTWWVAACLSIRPFKTLHSNASQRPYALSRNLPGALLRQHYLSNLRLKLKVVLHDTRSVDAQVYMDCGGNSCFFVG